MINITRSLKNLCINCLVDALDVKSMKVVAKKLVPGYNIYQRTGIPENIPLQPRDFANQIVKDAIDNELFPNLICIIIELQNEGHMGRKYNFSSLGNILRELYELGYLFDNDSKMLVENPKVHQTRNWGTLKEGVEYNFSFMSIDVVKNSSLVRNNKHRIVKKTYNDLLGMIHKAIYKRNGRLWYWEGDGGLVTFFFGNKHNMGALSAVEILHELFIYNKISCKLDNPLRIRIAIHSGQCEYRSNHEDLKNSEAVRKTHEIEKCTEPNAVSISPVAQVMIDPILTKRISRTSKGVYQYQLLMESQ